MATFGQATPSAFGHYRAAGTLSLLDYMKIGY